MISKIQPFFQFRLLFPSFFLILGFILAPYEHSFAQSYQYMLTFPLNAIFSLSIFSYFLPRAVFIVYHKEPNMIEQQYLYVLTILFAVLGLLVLH